MKYQDPMDQSRDSYVDALIDDAIENERSRTLHQKGRLLKERCAVELDKILKGALENHVKIH